MTLPYHNQLEAQTIQVNNTAVETYTAITQRVYVVVVAKPGFMLQSHNRPDLSGREVKVVGYPRC